MNVFDLIAFPSAETTQYTFEISETKHCIQSGAVRYRGPLKDLLPSLSPKEQVFYFKDQETDKEYLGLGLLQSFSFDDPQWEQINNKEGVHLCLALAFDIKAQPTGPWKRFDMPMIFIPETMLIRENDQVVAYTTGRMDSYWSDQTTQDSPLVSEIVKAPTQKLWNDFLTKALSRIRDPQDSISKIVCARSLELTCNKRPSSVELFEKLNSNNRFYFYLNSDEMSFLGNTPEKLLERRGNEYSFDALAGTRPRSTDPVKDRELEEQLIQSDKEQFEHNQVVQYITEGLSQWGDVTRDDQFVLKLKSLQHLKTPLRLKVKDNTGSFLKRLIERLHPTPAVGGMPKDQAMSFLSENDPLNRGLYAGAIGISTKETTLLCVGIRSLLCDEREKRVTLYGGAGIVADSDIQSEWEETGLKMRSFSPYDLGNDYE